MELIPGSETSTHLFQTPGINPEDNTLQNNFTLTAVIDFEYLMFGGILFPALSTQSRLNAGVEAFIQASPWYLIASIRKLMKV
jgi:hypothetical protein